MRGDIGRKNFHAPQLAGRRIPGISELPQAILLPLCAMDPEIDLRLAAGAEGLGIGSTAN